LLFATPFSRIPSAFKISSIIFFYLGLAFGEVVAKGIKLSEGINFCSNLEEDRRSILFL